MYSYQECYADGYLGREHYVAYEDIIEKAKESFSDSFVLAIKIDGQICLSTEEVIKFFIEEA